MPRKARPPINFIQVQEHDLKILANGAFGEIQLNGNTISITEDMYVGGDRINGEGHAYVNRIQIRGIVMARKDVVVSIDSTESKKDIDDMLEKKMREVHVIKGCSKCPFIVHFYGFFVHREGGSVKIHIFMEELALSASALIRQVKKNGAAIPVFVIGRIACSVVHALCFLKEKMQMIHRDVKPSNILIDHDGRVKICDFGISGVLQNSLAKTVVGCQQYTAPEILLQSINSSGYSVKSDIWSLGITIFELSTLRVPYSESSGIPLTGCITDQPEPRLNPAEFSKNIVNFTIAILQKNKEKRANFQDIKSLPFFIEHDVPILCIGTGLGLSHNHLAERPSVGAWLDEFLFPDSR